MAKNNEKLTNCKQDSGEKQGNPASAAPEDAVSESISALLPEREKPNIEFVSIGSVMPCPENDTLYKPVDPIDPANITLANDIKRRGILEPMVVSEDGYLLSGHRRLSAAKVAGLKVVPVIRRQDVNFEADPEGFLKLLASHNMQRVKTFFEIRKEESVLVNHGNAYLNLLKSRGELLTKSNMFNRDAGEVIELRETKHRKKFSKAKKPFAIFVRRTVESLKEFHPLSDRQIHYNVYESHRCPLRNLNRPESKYLNDKASWRDLTDALTRLRLFRMVPFSAIVDATRPVVENRGFMNAQEFIRNELNGLFQGYWRNLMQSQPNHIEIVGEKQTIEGVVRRASVKYTIPYTIGRGYCSLNPRQALVERFHRSGRHKLILLILSDLDPDGDNIAESFARSIRDDFGVSECSIEARKVALSTTQVEELGIPPRMTVTESGKKASTRKRFIEMRGENVFELEAVSPGKLYDILETAIRAVLDVSAFNKEVAAEREDAANLEGERRTLLRLLSHGQDSKVDHDRLPPGAA